MKINYNFFAFSLLFFTVNFIDGYCDSSKGNIYISCDSNMLGNRLFVFCYSKIIAENLNLNLLGKPIEAFPETYHLKVLGFNSNFPSEIIGDYIDPEIITQNKKTRNIKGHGYYQRYEYYKPYKKQIKQWLKFDSAIIPYDKEDIVLHIRSLEEMYYLPFEYYKKALEQAKYNKVYICIDDPNSPFLENFKPYDPIIIKHLNPFNKESTLHDFKFIMSFNKIISSQSTFSWWASFLSNATEIYAPRPNHGLMSEPQVNLYIDDEKRYKYIECNW